MPTFTGSYTEKDVIFLLKPLPKSAIDDRPVAQKETLIQQGKKHYSEMLTFEKLPSPQYMQLFEQAMSQNAERMVQDCVVLAKKIQRQFAQKADTMQDTLPIIVSLARAGTPVGVLLKHILTDLYQRESSSGSDEPKIHHYAISIIRDRGIDDNALDYIISQHGDAGRGMVFVDGWTAKGVINDTLKHYVTDYNQRKNSQIDTALAVLADISGQAELVATYDDYLIPSSILNATVSGLISRSILNDSIGAGDFHGCFYYQDFEQQDRTQNFIQTLMVIYQQQSQQMIAKATQLANISESPEEKAAIAQKMRDFIAQEMQANNMSDINLFKPGIGEATRVVLRRVPQKVLLKAKDIPETQHLQALAQEKNIQIEIRPDMPYFAAAIIRSEA